MPGARISESLCAGHNLRADKLGLVEEFIVEFEGARKDCDITRWGQFTDIKDIKEEMLTRLEAHFKKWLNP